MENTNDPVEANPLSSLEQWEEDLLERYPDPDTIAKGKTAEEYRNYDSPERESVKKFYRLNHTYQTFDFVQKKKAEYLRFDKREMSVWDAFTFLNQLVDDSDPDTDLDQFQHLLLGQHKHLGCLVLGDITHNRKKSAASIALQH